MSAAELDIVLALGWLVAGVLLLIRNERVYRFRVTLLGQVSALSVADIYAELDWMWRYRAFNSATYMQMVFQFWKPLRADAWYSDTRFLGGAS